MWSERQIIEIFHLLFIAHLGRKVDKAFFVIKGGCNLRFFCRSIRYSQDLDIDIRTMAVGTLRNNVTAVLKSPALNQSLLTQQITIQHLSTTKQTDTTQRWKVGITHRSGKPIPTKIEFSRRKGLESDHLLEPVDAELIRTYGLYPVLAQHYSREAAFRQKVVALSRRTETQARDIFDLKLLLDGGAGKQPLPAHVTAEISRAIENALTVGFDEFSGQVLAYLANEDQDDYRSRQIWDSLQEEVVRALEDLQS